MCAMGGAAFRSVASARLLVGVTVAVVVAFVAATAVAQYVESRSAKHIEDLVGNAMPSIEELARARGELRSIDHLISQRRPGDRVAERILENRRNIDAALASYVALPFFPGERSMYASVPGLLARLDRELAGVDAGLDDAADDAAIERCRETLGMIDQVMQRMVTFDAEQGQRLGLSFAEARSRSRVLVWLLDAGSVVLAAGALALALRQHRRAIRVVDEERAVAEHQLSELRTQVDELGTFAGRVAHDIRSPLQTALLTMETVRDAAMDEATAQRTLATGTAALQRMTVLIDGLLEFARAGGKPAEGVVADVRDIVEELVEGLAAEAKSRRIALTADVPPSARVACSAGVLTSIVANLTRNAIHHMRDAAERRVDIRVHDVDARWRIEVRDTGPGIPPGQQRRIFEPHVQLGSGSGGIGLGLATVDRLVRAHGGGVGVISQPADGSVFWVELPKSSLSSPDTR
jgi:signal transduction histidine kinase